MLRRKTVPKDQGAHFVGACAVEMHMDIWQEQFCVEMFRKNAVRQSRGKHFVRAWAVETHMDIWEEPFCVKFTGKMLDAHENISIRHRALTVPVRTPSVWPHCLGNKQIQRVNK